MRTDRAQTVEMLLGMATQAENHVRELRRSAESANDDGYRSAVTQFSVMALVHESYAQKFRGLARELGGDHE